MTTDLFSRFGTIRDCERRKYSVHYAYTLRVKNDQRATPLIRIAKCWVIPSLIIAASRRSMAHMNFLVHRSHRHKDCFISPTRTTSLYRILFLICRPYVCDTRIRNATTTIYSVSQKNTPCGLQTFFPKRLGISNKYFTHLLCVPIYARLQIFIQLSRTLTKLCRLSVTTHRFFLHFTRT